MKLRDLLKICKYTDGEPAEVDLYDSQTLDPICTFSGDMESLKDYLLDAEVESFGPDDYKVEIIIKLEG